MAPYQHSKHQNTFLYTKPCKYSGLHGSLPKQVHEFSITRKEAKKAKTTISKSVWELVEDLEKQQRTLAKKSFRTQSDYTFD